MNLTKKNRIAIVVSIFWLIFAMILSDSWSGVDFTMFFVFGLPVWIYWAYRFIKGN